jgi:UPF0042 nucleotide-binding protein
LKDALNLRHVIISGRSGSGKSVALHALEDRGFYCIDNLPVALLPELEQYIGTNHPLVAVSIDARNMPTDLLNFKDIINQLNSQGKTCEILYLDADDNTLLKRFSETRRKHPLSNEITSLREAIRKEHNLLTPIASLADLTIDTSPLSRQSLHNLVVNRVAHHTNNTLQLLLQSFGFKHGIPPDADFVFDVRCLPNPYWDPSLRENTGLDKDVIQYLSTKPEVNKMLNDIYRFLVDWIPHFIADNRSYMTIALGCTGGQHRSVYLIESIAEKIRSQVPNTQVRHRELKR